MARIVTSQFHAVQNSINILEINKTQSESADNSTSELGNSNIEIDNNIKRLKEKLENLGGKNRYQEASIVSTNHFKTSRYIC
jgi:xanthine dehydrogenase molybdopterin-binding subunit B